MISLTEKNLKVMKKKGQPLKINLLLQLKDNLKNSFQKIQNTIKEKLMSGPSKHRQSCYLIVQVKEY